MSSLYGRDDEQAVLVDHLTRLQDGIGRVLYLSGPAGIGKTELLDFLIGESRRLGVPVLKGVASDHRDEPAYAIWRDAVEDHMTRNGNGRPPLASSIWRPHLAIAFPSAYGTRTRSRTTPTAERRHEVYGAITALLRRIASDAPTVLILEDVHEADASSLDALIHLVRRYPKTPLLTVISARPPAAFLDPHLGSKLRDDTRRLHGAGSAIELRPLPDRVAELLVSAELPDAQHRHAEILRLSQGNPFYLRELVDHVRKGYLLAPGPEGVVENLPIAIKDAMSIQFDRLRSETTRELLRAASVLGVRFALPAAAAAAGTNLNAAGLLIEDHSVTDFVNRVGETDEFRFRHELLQSFVYATAKAEWRRAARRRLVAWLRQNGEPDEVLAPHVERSATLGDDEDIRILTAAAAAASAHDPATAVKRYRAALSLLDGPKHQGLQVDLRIGAALALANSKELEPAIPLLNEARERTDSSERRTFCTAFGAAVLHLLGRHEQAQARLVNALKEVPIGDHRDRAKLALEIAAGWGWTSRSDRALAAAAEARALAEAEPKRAILAAAEGLYAYASLQGGTLATESMDRATSLMRELSEEELVENPMLPMYVAWSLVQYERFTDAVALCDRTLETAARLGNEAFLNGIRTARACALFGLGDLQRADDRFRWLVDSMDSSPQVFLVQVGGLACLTSAYLGKPDAREFGEAAVARARSQEGTVLPGAAAVYLGMSLVEAGEHEHAIELLHRFAPADLSGLLRSSRHPRGRGTHSCRTSGGARGNCRTRAVGPTRRDAGRCRRNAAPALGERRTCACGRPRAYRGRRLRGRLPDVPRRGGTRQCEQPV